MCSQADGLQEAETVIDRKSPFFDAVAIVETPFQIDYQAARSASKLVLKMLGDRARRKK